MTLAIPLTMSLAMPLAIPKNCAFPVHFYLCFIKYSSCPIVSEISSLGGLASTVMVSIYILLIVASDASLVLSLNTLTASSPYANVLGKTWQESSNIYREKMEEVQLILESLSKWTGVKRILDNGHCTIVNVG